MDYTIFYKTHLRNDADWSELGQFDLFISMYDCSDRVISNFTKISATHKHWILTPHHVIPQGLQPQTGKVYNYPVYEEDEYLHRYFSDISNIITADSRICIDITGFIRPFIVYIVRLLHSQKYKSIDVIYAEPFKYLRSEETVFSGFVDEVKSIPACTATDINPKIENDILILAIGYDDKLITAVADQKKHCKIKYQIYGFPSMQPDMYQESVLRAYNAKESLGNEVLSYYSPAFDPFVTAAILQEIVDVNSTATNIYLSPISTKPQVLGFVLYFIWEGIDKHCNLIFPYSRSYSIKTCQGVNKAWHYKVELP